MADYIDRDALKDRIAGFVPLFIDESNQAYVDGLTDAHTLICHAPAADVVERKTGKWIHATLGLVKMPIVKCSECGLKEVWHKEDGMGFALHGQKYANFCPNCGAKMEAPTDV